MSEYVCFNIHKFSWRNWGIKKLVNACDGAVTLSTMKGSKIDTLCVGTPVCGATNCPWTWLKNCVNIACRRATQNSSCVIGRV